MKKIIYVYAPDRVGKTTYAKTLAEAYNLSKPLQFDVPLMNTCTWHSDYDRALTDEAKIVCARGYLEANIYRHVTIKEMSDYHRTLVRNDYSVKHVLLCKHWGHEMIHRHSAELEALGHSHHWRINSEIGKRRDFHFDYYKKFEHNVIELDIDILRINM